MGSTGSRLGRTIKALTDLLESGDPRLIGQAGMDAAPPRTPTKRRAASPLKIMSDYEPAETQRPPSPNSSRA